MLVGIRSVDAGEREYLRKLGRPRLHDVDIDRRGMHE